MGVRAFGVIALSRLEKGICYGSLSILALMPIADLVLRQFSIAISASRAIMSHLFLVMGFFAAMMTVKSGEHISVTAIQYLKNAKVKRYLEIAGTLICILVLSVLVWDCISFIKFGLIGKKVGIIPDQVFAIAMPLGYAVMAVRFVGRICSGKGKFFALAAILLGTAAAFPAIAIFIWDFDLPAPILSCMNFMYDAAFLVRVPAIILLIVAALAGMPIFAAIGGIALVMFQAEGRQPVAVPLQIFYSLTRLDLVAIPLFTLTGFFLSESRAGERLVRTFKVFFGWLPGGMIIASVVICAFFASFTGASGVTILALGGILYTILIQNKYPPQFSIGLLTSVGGIGVMFPPSLAIILVGTTSNSILHLMNVPSNYSIVHFFTGAVIPGLILVIAIIIAGIILSAKVKVPVGVFEPKEALLSLKESFFEILLPFVLIAGILTGWLTLIEASALSVIYVVIVEVVINKDISVANIPKVFAKAVPIIGGVLAILAMAQVLSEAIIDSDVPQNFAAWMQGAITSKWVFLLLLNLALLVVGFVMDIFSAIFVLLPLIIPLGHAYGIDPVHLGIIFIMNLEVGLLTPPVGLNLFLASYRFEQPFIKICRYVLPFLLVHLAVVLLITYVPWLSTWLPGLRP